MKPSRFARLWNYGLLVTLLFATCAVDARAFAGKAVNAPDAEMPSAARGVDRVDGVAWVARHGITGEQFQTAFDDLGSQGYRPVQVSGFAYGNTALYNAIWEQRGGPALQVRHGLTNAQYQQTVNDLSAAGYRPLWVSGYTDNGEERYATIWEQSSGPAWIARHGLTNAQYQTAFTDYANAGYRLVEISGYAIGNQDYYAAIWEQRDGPAWQGRHNLTSAQYQDTVNELSGQGYRPLLVNGYTVNNEARFATIWEQTGGPLWDARHGLTNVQYQAAFNDLATRGYKLRNVSGYTVDGQDYYAAIWEQTVQPFSSLPQTGVDVPELAIFDQTMQNYMVTRQIPAGALTVMKDGVIVLQRGYGWQDHDQTILLQPDAMLRLASVVKPIEEISGKSYMDYIHDEIFTPLCVPERDIQLGGSLPNARNAREPWYSDPNTAQNVFNPSQTVLFPDGGYYIEAMEAHGGLIASGDAMAKFLQGYWIDGQPRSGNGQTWWFFGSLPGTHTLTYQRADGINIVALFLLDR